MIDAILHAVKATLIRPGSSYDNRTCDIRDTGKPPPICGDVFVAVHQGASRSTNDNCLMEYLGFNLTLTMRVDISLDRIGEQLLARKLAKATGFNRRAEALKNQFHMAWDVLQMANEYLADWIDPSAPGSGNVYGFGEPARFTGMDIPKLMGPEWFDAAEGEAVALVAELRFEDARRMQPIGGYA